MIKGFKIANTHPKNDMVAFMFNSATISTIAYVIRKIVFLFSPACIFAIWKKVLPLHENTSLSIVVYFTKNIDKRAQELCSLRILYHYLKKVHNLIIM